MISIVAECQHMITDEIKINEKSMTIDEIGPNFV
jgi:hypothetical protein